MPLSRRATLKFGSNPRTYSVVPYGIYYVYGPSAQLELGRIGLPTNTDISNSRGSIAAIYDDTSPSRRQTTVEIPVKIAYDSEDITRRQDWERRIRARIETASKLFERQCFATFKVVAVEDWHVDPQVEDVDRLLTDFESKVVTAPARLSIAFYGRALRVPEDGHLGGTRGPLHTHLVVREWAIENSESERLELLVHELGHFLGAAHSPESASVMRPALGDRQARAARYRCTFDPLNMMAMCLVSRELRLRPQAQFQSLEPDSKQLLRAIYTSIQEALPSDPAAPELIRQLNRPARR